MQMLLYSRRCNTSAYENFNETFTNLLIFNIQNATSVFLQVYQFRVYSPASNYCLTFDVYDLIFVFGTNIYVLIIRKFGLKYRWIGRIVVDGTGVTSIQKIPSLNLTCFFQIFRL